MPFIVRWPGRVKPGVSDAIVSQVDFLATFATLTGQSLAAVDVPDSFGRPAGLARRFTTGRDHVGRAGNRRAGLARVRGNTSSRPRARR